MSAVCYFPDLDSAVLTSQEVIQYGVNIARIEMLNNFKKLIKNKTVYLTFDVDGFDSSIMPATGTPEPGGLLWDETLNIIKIAAKHSNIIGADINELSPIKGFNSYNFLVAKLAYKIISYTFEFSKKFKY